MARCLQIFLQVAMPENVAKSRPVMWSEVGFVILWICAVGALAGAERVGICAMDGCNCTVAAHRWITVKCIFDRNQDVELVEGVVPADAMEVEVSQCRELRIQAGAFTGGAQLKRVHVSGIYSVVAKRQAFQNLSAPNPLLEVSECDSVILESHAFRNARGPLSVSISRCKHLAIKPNAFSWLLRITVKEVLSVELSSNAFKFETPPHGRHGPATKIMFQNVKIAELPTALFPSMAGEVRMDNVQTKVIRKDAFCAMNILSVAISNATLLDVEAGAFTERTYIDSLEFVDVRMKNIRSGALRAAVNNLTIQYSSLSAVESGAINTPAAIVTFNNNEFQHLHRNSVVLRKWTRISIDQNLFEVLEEDAIVAKEAATSAPNSEFSFTGNRIRDPKPGSLKILGVSQQVSQSRVGTIYFQEKCSCNLDSWMQGLYGKNESTGWLMNASFCAVDGFLSSCLNVPEGVLPMQNFTRLICFEGSHIVCEKPLAKPEPSASPPSVGPHVYPRQKGYFDVEMSDSEQLDREKRIILVICLVVILSVATILLVTGGLYARRRGVCAKISSGPLHNLASWMSPGNNEMTAATSARSISRMSVHEYAGLRPETRILDVETTPVNLEEDEVFAYTENKATQTLPEELTEEYLRELREKLNDPDDYGRARDMIEHLYDLIKVEESCNNNNEEERLHDPQENPYDVVVPRSRARPRGPPKPSTSVGTRVPSLEKLLPSAVSGPRPPIAEYTEPRDLRTSDQNHLYAELPGDEALPSTSRLHQPDLGNSALLRAPQPLPPDVLNDLAPEDRISDRSNIRLEQKIQAESPGRREQSRSQAKPLGFLKALGESILGATRMQNPSKRPNSLLCEYADPSDVTAHLYSELPEPQASSSGKMANRPLPIKPDHGSARS
ncbi:uncharacterized protein LOC105702299 [Orussus abietinus]|uniref:uncharacterized protein LOC105702299 n=1 Tax=Orussus abietinus TaxID=222816 RepID=UPI000626C64B|nr:uncharacterized protein LOC105702299 [Orussus abietinus]